MAERPIIFSGPMVNAIILAKKTQTRRAVKKPAVLEWLDQFLPEFVAAPDNHLSPYGYAGDRLWVRETFAAPWGLDYHLKFYRADHPEPLPNDGRWTPSIYMPRQASRLKLHVNGVRIERLKDISEEDARAEGVSQTTNGSYRASFALLWDSLNAKRGCGWDLNPWVWVIDFRVAA
jgi:hypothetical protein